MKFETKLFLYGVLFFVPVGLVYAWWSGGEAVGTGQAHAGGAPGDEHGSVGVLPDEGRRGHLDLLHSREQDYQQCRMSNIGQTIYSGRNPTLRSGDHGALGTRCENC